METNYSPSAAGPDVVYKIKPHLVKHFPGFAFVVSQYEFTAIASNQFNFAFRSDVAFKVAVVLGNINNIRTIKNFRDMIPARFSEGNDSHVRMIF